MSNVFPINKKVLICGDSFAVTDEQYPGLHFSEKMASNPDLKVINYAAAGASNAMIAMQLLQGIAFKPDFVVLMFTNYERYEYDHTVPLPMQEVTAESVAQWQQSRYITNSFQYMDHVREKNKYLHQWRYGVASDQLERLKNYFYVCMCLSVCQSNQIPFCFSLGGFEYIQNYRGFYKQHYTVLLEQNYCVNLLEQHSNRMLPTNLWSHHDGKTMSPRFHIADNAVQTQFANECEQFIKEQFC